MVFRKRINLWYLSIPTFKNRSSEKRELEICQRKLDWRIVDPSKSKPFNDTEEQDGRPRSITMMKDGSMLVSDDYAGAIYKISYVGS